MTRTATLAMIAACFRHQHPEAFDRPPIPLALLHPEVRGRYREDDARETPAEFAEPSDRGRADAVGIGEAE